MAHYFGFTAADREWRREFASLADAQAWADHQGATVTGELPTQTAADRADLTADTIRRQDDQWFAIRGRRV